MPRSTKAATTTQFRKLEFAAQIQHAKPFARALLTAGIEGLGNSSPTDAVLSEIVEELTGEDPGKHVTGDDEGLSSMERGLWGALVLGVAYGLMLRPDVFDGGAR